MSKCILFLKYLIYRNYSLGILQYTMWQSLKKNIPYSIALGIPSGLAVKYPPAVEGTRVQFLDQDDLLVMPWQPTSVFLPGKILWTEEPGGLQSMELQRVRQDWVTNTFKDSFSFPPNQQQPIFALDPKSVLDFSHQSRVRSQARVSLCLFFRSSLLLFCFRKRSGKFVP